MKLNWTRTEAELSAANVFTSEPTGTGRSAHTEVVESAASPGTLQSDDPFHSFQPTSDAIIYPACSWAGGRELARHLSAIQS